MLLHISALHVSMSYNKEDSMFDRTVCVLYCFLDLETKKNQFPQGYKLNRDQEDQIFRVS